MSILLKIHLIYAYLIRCPYWSVHQALKDGNLCMGIQYCILYNLVKVVNFLLFIFFIIITEFLIYFLVTYNSQKNWKYPFQLTLQKYYEFRYVCLNVSIIIKRKFRSILQPE